MRGAVTTLDDLLAPQSIAIVGASEDKRRIGGRPLAHMIEQKFDGPVYPVNAKRDVVQGLDAYPSVADLPTDVDFVLIAVPAKGVGDVVRQAAAKNAKTVLIFSSGFAEVGGDGIAMQDDLQAIASETGVRVIGPNCLGAFNSALNFYPTFTSTIDRATPTPGGISIISQSGAYGSHIYMVSHMRGLGIRYWLTTGNECDVNVSDIIKLYAEDENVHTIAAYAESIKDGPALIDALETARANRKPVIIMKVGRSEVGAAAASSHTASLAGEDRVYDAVFRQYGAYRARSTEEMLDIAYACRPRIYPTGNRVGLVTISGGAGVLMSDAADDYGLDVAPMPDDAQAQMKEILPFAAPRNPVDVTAQFFNDLSLVPRFTKLMLERGNYDGLIGFWTSVAGSPLLAEPLITSLKQAMAEDDDVCFIQSIIAPAEIQAQYEEAGFPCFEDPTRAVAAMSALMRFGMSFGAAAVDRPDIPTASELPDGALSEGDAVSILVDAGLPMAVGMLATGPGGAELAVEQLGGERFVVKVASEEIQHKTEVGGVRVNVAAGEIAAAYKEVVANAERHAPDADVFGALVVPMAPAGVDCILGAKVDPVFGPVVMFGLGGIFTEVLEDVALRNAPVSVATAHEMINELKGVAVLKGARGADPADFGALAEAISRFSVFAAANAHQIASVEINPLRALPERCLGLDALIVKASGDHVG
ncbi:MAG: acetate--CoA ligase family protein [Pseudomonadota bacterium]